MGFWKRLFGAKKTKQEIEPQEKINFHDNEERQRYLVSCLEQIGEAQKELELLHGEYQLVSSYLTDMEEIEALPVEESAELKAEARKMLALEKERMRYRDKKNRMEDSIYKKIESREDEIEEGITKMQDAEKYRKLVRQDLNRLDGERSAYQYRKSELATMMVNLKGMATICLTALGACVLMLAVLKFGFKLDTTVGFIISVSAAAVAITVLCVKYMDAQKEMTKVEKAGNKLILLQNKVKIRYVNNTNLLDYYYMKYEVDSAQTLDKRWKLFKQEKEERRQYAETEAKLEYYQERLLKILRRYQLKDPDRWIHQANAIVDNREMIEIRHGLIVRRQSLRSQMEYNQKVAETASDEIKNIAVQFPQYQEEISAMVERYEKSYASIE